MAMLKKSFRHTNIVTEPDSNVIKNGSIYVTVLNSRLVFFTGHLQPNLMFATRAKALPRSLYFFLFLLLYLPEEKKVFTVKKSFDTEI
jgi:hypothetical protein